MKTMLLSMLIGFGCIHSTVMAEPDLTTRMSDRRGVIEQLKAEGLVGENNKGYLEFVGSTKKNEDLVAAQNADRKVGYQLVADKQGVAVEQISAVRASYYAKKAEKGEWYQDSSGKWIQK
jgi:uncharacterized protein